MYKSQGSVATRAIFWATVCKTVRPMLSDRCLSCLQWWDELDENLIN